MINNNYFKKLLSSIAFILFIAAALRCIFVSNTIISEIISELYVSIYFIYLLTSFIFFNIDLHNQYVCYESTFDYLKSVHENINRIMIFNTSENTKNHLEQIKAEEDVFKELGKKYLKSRLYTPEQNQNIKNMIFELEQLRETNLKKK